MNAALVLTCVRLTKVRTFFFFLNPETSVASLLDLMGSFYTSYHKSYHFVSPPFPVPVLVSWRYPQNKIEKTLSSNFEKHSLKTRESKRTEMWIPFWFELSRFVPQIRIHVDINGVEENHGVFLDPVICKEERIFLFYWF